MSSYLTKKLNVEILNSLSLKAEVLQLTDNIMKAKTRLEILEIGQELLRKLQRFLEIQENIRYYQVEHRELMKK